MSMYFLVAEGIQKTSSCRLQLGVDLSQKIVQPDHFWLPKFGSTGPNLAAKNGPGRP